MNQFFEPFALQAGPRFPTAAGPRLVAPPMRLVIPNDPNQALLFSNCCNRQSDLLLSEGRVELAERIAHLGLEARLRALGGQA